MHKKLVLSIFLLVLVGLSLLTASYATAGPKKWGWAILYDLDAGDRIAEIEKLFGVPIP